MNKYVRKILAAMLVLITVFSIYPLNASARSSAESFDYVRVVKHQSYNQDGNFVMSFTIRNVGSYNLYVWARLFNSAGKEITYWRLEEYETGCSEESNFLMDYSDLPSGKYTFRLYCSFSSTTFDGWRWSFPVDHEQSRDNMSFSYKYYEKVIIDGNVRHRFHIQCTNMEGKRIIFRIYDSYGYLVMQHESDTYKTNNLDTWVTWTGYSSMGGERYKCPSGEYTLTVTTSGSDLLLEETIYLNIVEEVKG